MKSEITKGIKDQLKAFCDQAEELRESFGINNWSQQVASFLETALGTDRADEFISLKQDDEWQQLALRVGHIQGIVAKATAEEPTNEIDVNRNIASVDTKNPSFTGISRKVFVVHGRDNEAKETMARFLEKLGLQPIILHEQPNSGRTIIEKFETYSSDISFAVVLLTPDDIGGINEKSQKQLPRARQNVIMELGYFMGRLGRTRVCALHTGGVELPSDYQGVVYIAMDSAGAWKAKVAQELIQSKLSIDLTGLVGG